MLNILIACANGIPPDDENVNKCKKLLGSLDPPIDESTRMIEDAFSPKIQRRLASSVPPRPMVVADHRESIKFLQQLFHDISSAFEMLSIHHSFDLFNAYNTFMAQKPEPSMYVRALLQSFLNLRDHVLGQETTKDFVIGDLKSLVLPADPLLDSANELVENPVDPRFRIANQMNQFIVKASPAFLNQFHSFCQNRCRLRRFLCHAVIEMDNLQADAEEVDGHLQVLVGEPASPYSPGEPPTYAYPLSSWVYHYKLIQLGLIVQMGFELSIYALHEFSEMYWYLGHLASIHLSHLERISYFVSQHASDSARTSREERLHETQKALSLLYRHFARLKATDTLASALHRLYAVLQRHGHCVKSSPLYSSDELRFDLRMRPFQHLTIPEPLTVKEMKGLSSLDGLRDREALDQASRLALTAKKAWEDILKQGWSFEQSERGLSTSANPASKGESVIETEWTKDVKNSMKACISTSIAISSLTKLLDNNGRDAERLKSIRVTVPGPEDRERFHRCWAVPKVWS